MRITLADIAKKAGVSTAAVSQVLNNHAHAKALRPETRAKILQAVIESGYSRNEAAAEIRTGLSKTIALLLEFSHSAVRGAAANEILLGLLNATAEHGYNVRICNLSNLELVQQELVKYNIRYAACFAFSPLLQKEIGNFCKARDIALCYIEDSCRNDFPLVYSDDQAATREIVRKLFAEGHRRIAVVKPEDDIRYSVERCNGVAAGLQEFGLKLNPHWISAHHDPVEHFADLESWFHLPEEERPTAFICFDDNRAAQVLITALRFGIRIPDSCRIFGFGNTLARQLYYPVGTVVQAFEKMGEAVLDILTGKTENKTAPARYLFPSEIKDAQPKPDSETTSGKTCGI